MKRKMMVLVAVVMAGIFSTALFPMISTAETIYVNGTVSGTWSADTVIVTGHLYVENDDTLTIEPGVKVLFQTNPGSWYWRFYVRPDATLIAAGTEQDSILFDVLNPNTGWNGLRIESSNGSSLLQYCHLTHGSTNGQGATHYGGAIACDASANPTIKNCLIDSCFATQGSAIWCTGSSSPIIEDNIIKDNTASTATIWSGINSSPLISKNLIIGNLTGSGGGGVSCFDNSNAI
ncbi:MAG: right-handed parallel beta-helix repeat-containing protein, partial [bacterium]